MSGLPGPNTSWSVDEATTEDAPERMEGEHKYGSNSEWHFTFEKALPFRHSGTIEAQFVMENGITNVESRS
jgi:hypothetical protein